VHEKEVIEGLFFFFIGNAKKSYLCRLKNKTENYEKSNGNFWCRIIAGRCCNLLQQEM
jgi:hypothetical protein